MPKAPQPEGMSAAELARIWRLALSGEVVADRPQRGLTDCGRWLFKYGEDGAFYARPFGTTESRLDV